MASQSEDYAAATEHLRKYVDGHIAMHGDMTLDIDDVYDNGSVRRQRVDAPRSASAHV